MSTWCFGVVIVGEKRINGVVNAPDRHIARRSERSCEYDSKRRCQIDTVLLDRMCVVAVAFCQGQRFYGWIKSRTIRRTV